MAQAAAMLVARHLPQAEIIDYASAMKPDAPSGTSRELAERLAQVRAPVVGRPLDEIDGLREARGATVAGVPVHRIDSAYSPSSHRVGVPASRGINKEAA